MATTTSARRSSSGSASSAPRCQRATDGCPSTTPRTTKPANSFWLRTMTVLPQRIALVARLANVAIGVSPIDATDDATYRFGPVRRVGRCDMDAPHAWGSHRRPWRIKTDEDRKPTPFSQKVPLRLEHGGGWSHTVAVNEGRGWGRDVGVITWGRAGGAAPLL